MANRFWKLRQRFGIAAPKVSVRTHVPWYLRWLGFAVMLAFSAALAAWMYDAGRRFAGFDLIQNAIIHVLERRIDDFGETASAFCYDAPVQHHILLLVDGKYTTHVSVSLTLGLRYLVLVSCGAGLCPRVLARFLMLGFERGKAHTPGYAGQAVTF